MSMTVKELKNLLNQLPENMYVLVGNPNESYGDDTSSCEVRRTHIGNVLVIKPELTSPAVELGA